MKLCPVPDCGGASYGKGYCRLHYGRYYHGRNLLAPIGKPSSDNRFLSSINIPSTHLDECFEYSRVKKSGYGSLMVNGRHVWAHRYSYQYFIGPIPDGLCVLHHCDNKKCVRPDHLYAGTKADNVRDAVQRGQHDPCRGEKGGRSVLTERMVLVIRSRRMAGESFRSLAEDYGVGKTTIRKVSNRETWKHI
jgi:hypothetical protein